MFFDLRIVTLVTPVTCLRPSFDMACGGGVQWYLDYMQKGATMHITRNTKKNRYFSLLLFLFFLTFLAFFSLRLCLALLTGSSSISAAAASYKTEHHIRASWGVGGGLMMTQHIFSSQDRKAGFSILRRTKVTVLIITEESSVKYILIFSKIKTLKKL